MPTVVSKFRPTPPQRWFLRSQARVKGYGGAMSGGKTRTMCEAVLDMCLDHPGIWILVVRQKHTAITATTRKTFFDLLPKELIERKKESGGEDWVDVKTSTPGLCSRVHFIGLDDPVKWFSSEIGALVVDEAHECSEDDVVTMRSRLRQRCPDCTRSPVFDTDLKPLPCRHYPRVTLMGFNPAGPNHWLRRWFIIGASETRFGFYKAELFVKDGDRSAGNAEFVVARAKDNPYMDEEYIEQNLGGMTKLRRRRYLDGEWVNISGSCFFDEDALEWYASVVEQPRWVAESCGSLTGAGADPIKFRLARAGPWAVFRPPVRERDGKPAHRYIVSVDPSSGASTDYSGIQVLDMEEFAQVAEFQGKMDTDLVADEAFRAAAVYNGALIVVETTGGYGAAIVQRMKKELLPRFAGPVSMRPRLYLRQKTWEKLSNEHSEVYGWDTNLRTRVLMLDTLEQAIRERSLVIRSQRTLHELVAFVWDDKKEAFGAPKPKAGAQSGENDDLVSSLAMGVTVFTQLPKTLRKPIMRPHEAAFAATGY